MADDGLIARSVLANQVKDRLLQDILSGRYRAHARIVETQVARELGTSQAPVREALRGLEALGVVEISPFRGARVRRPSATELLEAYEVRFELEALAARLAVPRITETDLELLQADFDDLKAMAAAGDAHAIALADARFHGHIMRMAGNATLERLWRSLEPFSRTYITLVAPGVDPTWTGDLHEPILRALQSRDAALVVEALHHHFDDAAAKLREGWLDAETEQGPARRRKTTARSTS
ncbi:MAG: GntR family transcriptional regulator [Candidatus Limnocylindrales bacterium]